MALPAESTHLDTGFSTAGAGVVCGIDAIAMPEIASLSVPSGTRHWFDMGARPDFVALRFFEEQDGWIGDFTGDPIGECFPTLDQLVAA